MFTPGTNCPKRPDVPGQREPGGGFSRFIDMFGHKNTVETILEHFFFDYASFPEGWNSLEGILKPQLQRTYKNGHSANTEVISNVRHVVKLTTSLPLLSCLYIHTDLIKIGLIRYSNWKKQAFRGSI